MSFLDRLFGTSDSKKKKTKTIRVQFKNEKYFDKELNYFDKGLKSGQEEDQKYLRALLKTR